MNFRPPIKLRNRLSQYSILALIGLIAFASIVLVANPFASQASGGKSIPAANVSPPPTAVSSPPAQQHGSGSGGQSSLLTGTPSPGQSGSSGFGASGGYHHDHHDDGNSTVDS